MNLPIWEGNWAWGVPLIVLTSVAHVLGLRFVQQTVGRVVVRGPAHRQTAMLVAAMSLTVLLTTALHALEAAVWAVTYRLLGALPDAKVAMLYSVSALTTYGHASALLPEHWRMLGALEALNGMILFGLTTAFLFAVIQELRSGGSTARRPTS